MTKNDVIEKLRAGYELANRGTGWWLSAPQKQSGSKDSVNLANELVDQMEAEGLLKIDLLTRSLVAMLIAEK